MDKKFEHRINSFIIDAQKNISLFKTFLHSIYTQLQQNQNYKNNILNYFDPIKDDKSLLSYYILFKSYNTWLNPNNINILNIYDEYFSFTPDNDDNKKDLILLKKMNEDKLLKHFIYWFFYLLYKLNIDNLIEIKNILVVTSHKLSILLDNGLNLEKYFVFSYIYLFFIEYTTKNNTHEKDIISINKIIFPILFDQLKKINLEKENLKLFFSFLEEIKSNSFVNNEYNVIILNNNKIIQKFIIELLNKIPNDLINYLIFESQEKFSDFLANFIKFRFKKCEVIDFLINNVKNSLINLSYFKENKSSIINDIFIQNLQSELLNKIFNAENSRNNSRLLQSCFLFNGFNSNISLKIDKNFNFNDRILFFSFLIKPKINNNNLQNNKQCILSFKKYNNSNDNKYLFKLYLEPKQNSDKYNLCFSLNSKKENTFILTEFGDIIPNVNYYICIHLNNTFINFYLYPAVNYSSKILKVNQKIKNLLPKEEKLIIHLGTDIKKQEYFFGYIGTFYIIEPTENIKNLDYANIDSVINNILQLKENYTLFMYLIHNNDLILNFDFLSFYQNKIEFSNILAIINQIKNKNIFDILLCLSPDTLKNLYFDEKEGIYKYNLPIISGICENNKNFIINNINVTFIKYEKSRAVFLINNGFNYFCLQLEYFYQFACHYLDLINNNDDEIKTFYSNKKVLFFMLIKSTIKNILFILVKYICDIDMLNFTTVLKQIFYTLFSTMLELNKIDNIIDQTFNQLSSTVILIRDKLSELYTAFFINPNLKKENIINLLTENKDIKTYILFRDGILDFLLCKELYKHSDYQFIETLFDKIFSIIDDNDPNHFCVTNPAIFVKVLSFTDLLNFIDYNPNVVKNNSNKFNNISVVVRYLKLIKGLIITEKMKSKEQTFFDQLLRFCLFDNKNNFYINYAFFKLIYDLTSDDNFDLKDIEITHLLNYTEDEIMNYDVENTEEEKNDINLIKIKHNLFIIIIKILIRFIYEKQKKKNLELFCGLIKHSEIDDDVLMAILNELTKIFTKSLENKINFSLDNDRNISNSSSNKEDININNLTNEKISEFNSHLFDFIFLLLHKIYDINETSSISTLKYNLNSINSGGKDKKKLEIINLLLFIDLTLAPLIKERKIQNMTIFCFMNLFKLIYKIIFDETISNLLLENNFLCLLQNFLEICYNSKGIIYSNIYLIFNEDNEIIRKTFSESLLDLSIKLILSDKIKDGIKEKKEHIEYSKVSILKKTDNFFLIKQDKIKNKDKDNHSLFFYIDCIRLMIKKMNLNSNSYVDTKKLDFSNIHEIFPNIDEDCKNSVNIYKLIKNEKLFEYNFTTFNLLKIRWHKNNIKQLKIESNNEILENLISFLDNLFFRTLEEHIFLYGADKDFFFKTNSKYTLYNILKKKIEIKITKKYDLLVFKEELELEDIDPRNLISSGLCDKTTTKKNKNFHRSQTLTENVRKRTASSFIEIKYPEEFSSPLNDNNSNKESLESDKNNFTTKTENDSESVSENSENYINNNIDNLNSSPSSKTSTSNISSTGNASMNYNTSNKLKKSFKDNSAKNLYKTKSNSDNFMANYEILQMKNLMDDNVDNLNKVKFFNEYDFMHIKSYKKELMKNVFMLNFLDVFYYNEEFLMMKNMFLQKYRCDISSDKNNSFLDYPTIIKNFSNGLEAPLFCNPLNSIFSHKYFHITHEYFENYMKKKELRSKNIILEKKNIYMSEVNKNSEVYECELTKINHSYFGDLTYSPNSEYFLFKQKIFPAKQNNDDTVDFPGLFSLSKIKQANKEFNRGKKKLEKENTKKKKNKTVVILFNEIEEIVERRFLLMWQGIEIYLKNGKSYFFNLLTKKDAEDLMLSIEKNPNLKNLIHRKNYFSKQKKITSAWETNQIPTYEYLLLINKYSSRSFNDPNQYPIFPWLLTKYKNLTTINNNIIKNSRLLRNMKYAMSLQDESSRATAIFRYDDDNEKFKFHLGTHYSTSSFIFYYLMRQEPFGTLLIKLQNEQQENPNRMFIGINETVDIIENGNDNRELIPEFFSKIDFMLNLNFNFYDYRNNKILVDDVNINFMSQNKNNDIIISDYVHFINEHKKLLNSEICSNNISEWINNIFGVNQLPPLRSRKNCCNIFRKSTYEQETNLMKKLQHYEEKKTQKLESIDELRFKIINKMNLIISFGQAPYQIFKDSHPKLYLTNNQNNENIETPSTKNDEKYLNDEEEDDEFEKIGKVLRPYSVKCNINKNCSYFEVNLSNNKLFLLGRDDEIIEIDSKIHGKKKSEQFKLSYKDTIPILHIKNFNSITTKNCVGYFILKQKYSFSSFQNAEIENNSNEKNENTINSSRKNSSNSNTYETNSFNSSIYSDYINNNNNYNSYCNNLINDIIKENSKRKSTDNEEISNYRFITCRFLDNSFKIYEISKNNNSKNAIFKKKNKDEITKKKQIFSYICEDFVMSCCTISSNIFLIGLRNGKLLRCHLETDNINNIETITKIYFDKNIQAHKGSITVIEVDYRLGVIITGGSDGYVFIRKLYDLELLTPIKLKKYFVIQMAKISNNNFLYIMCYNIKKKSSVIFGYTLTGLKFAKSHYSLFCNIDFTKSGNLVTFENNKEISVLFGHDLTKKKMSENDSFYENLIEGQKEVSGSVWMQFDCYLKKQIENDWRANDNIITFVKSGKNLKDNVLCCFNFKDNSFFD